MVSGVVSWSCSLAHRSPRGFGDGFPPESVFGADSGFDFGFRFWVHGDSTRSEPDPLPSLCIWQQLTSNKYSYLRSEPLAQVRTQHFWTSFMKTERNFSTLELLLQMMAPKLGSEKISGWIT